MSPTPQLPLDLRVERVASFENYRASTAAAELALIREHAAGYPQSSRVSTRESIIFVWGKAGSGKTHLLNASVAWARRVGRRAEYVSGAAVVSVSVPPELDLLCVDDVHKIAGEQDSERALFRLFEELRNSGAQLLVSGRHPPTGIEFNLADLRSRLMWGPVLRIDPLDDEDLRLHFKAHAERFGMALTEDVVDYVLQRCPRDAGYLEALASALHRWSLAERRHVTVRMVSQFIAEQSRES